MRRATIRLCLLIGLTTACRTVTPGDDAAQLAAEATRGPMPEITAKYRGQLEEISGISLSPGATGEVELYAVGDKEFVLGNLRLDRGDLRPLSRRRLPLTGLFPDAEGDAQWEGIATDGAGRIFILEESPGRIFILDPDGKSLLQTIRLDYGPVPGGGSVDSNSLGEGLVLLRDGHVLVMKEKNPPLLVEFGPGGEAAGVTPETILGEGDSFRMAATAKITYRPLKSWRFTAEAQALMHDFSEVVVGPGPVLYVLSDESVRIGKLESRLRVSEEKINVKRYWDIPERIKHPEGLGFIGGRPVVASDRKDGDDDIFVLTPLE